MFFITTAPNSAIVCCAVIRNIEEGLLSYAGAPAPLNEVENLDDDVTDLVLPMGEEYAADIFDLQSDFKVRVWGQSGFCRKNSPEFPAFTRASICHGAAAGLLSQFAVS